MTFAIHFTRRRTVNRLVTSQAAHTIAKGNLAIWLRRITSRLQEAGMVTSQHSEYMERQRSPSKRSGQYHIQPIVARQHPQLMLMLATGSALLNCVVGELRKLSVPPPVRAALCVLSESLVYGLP